MNIPDIWTQQQRDGVDLELQIWVEIRRKEKNLRNTKNEQNPQKPNTNKTKARGIEIASGSKATENE